MTYKAGDKVEFTYHDTFRQGTIDRTWDSYSNNTNGVTGFCLDHGTHYRSYSEHKITNFRKV